MFLQPTNHYTFHKNVFLLWMILPLKVLGYEERTYTRPHFLNMKNINDLFNLQNLLNEFSNPRVLASLIVSKWPLQEISDSKMSCGSAAAELRPFLTKEVPDFISISRVPGVTEMMIRYNETVEKAYNISDSLPDHPFIVIESVYNAGRRTVTELVAHALGAVYSTNPPKIMQGFSTAFDGMFLRRKYYALAKYASSNLVKHARKYQPVVMEKYYYDQAIFVIAKTYVDTPLPGAGDDVYKWPSDLVKPDLVFFLNFPDDPTTNLFTQKMIQLFRTMDDPAVIEVDAGHSVHIMANNIIHHINTRLEREYPLLSDRPREPLM